MPRTAAGLPEPDAEAHRHAERVTAHVRAELERSGGAIPFARYMDLVLHAPGLGYYSAGSAKFGAVGDFVTAPEISPLFGRCLARQLADLVIARDGGNVMEFGPGTGAMACQVLAELDRLGALPCRYRLLEPSADLRERQQALLGRRLPHLAARLEWLDRAPAEFSGVVVANEVLDAMPVHRLLFEGDALKELYVCWRDGRFAWIAGEPSDTRLAPHVGRLVAELGREGFADGYVIEVNLAMEAWLATVAASLRRGAIWVIDYGFPRAEFYHPQRGGGTLMCHYRHRAHADPLILPGLQDVTAHVDFTALAEAAVANGLAVAGYATQADFLLSSGLAEMAEAEMSQASAADRARLSHEIQRLTFPGEMGELFKVMALTRGLDAELRGFAVRDERGRL